MSGYGCFSRYYDTLTQNVDYPARARFFDETIRRLGSADIVLDLACGTGNLSIALARLGYDVIGVDASPEMLSVAMEKSGSEKSGVLFLNQDMASLDLFGTVDATVCALDSINHISGERELLKAFKRVSLFTVSGGLFIFDVNTAYKHREILGNNTFVYDMPEVFCCWRNSYSEARGRVDIALDFFVPNENGSYRRESESFSEWVYPPETILDLLSSSGFEHIETLDGDSFTSLTETSQRLVYVARKI